MSSRRSHAPMASAPPQASTPRNASAAMYSPRSVDPAGHQHHDPGDGDERGRASVAATRIAAAPSTSRPSVAATPGWEGRRATSLATPAEPAHRQAGRGGQQPVPAPEQRQGADDRADGQLESPVAVVGGGHRRVGGEDGGEHKGQDQVRHGLGPGGDAVRHVHWPPGYAARPDRRAGRKDDSGRAEPFFRPMRGRGRTSPEAGPMTTAPPIIETRGLTKRFGSRTAVVGRRPDRARPAARSGSSATTGPARPRSSGCWSASPSPTPARSRSPASPSRRTASRCWPGSGPSSRNRASTPISPAGRTSG